MAGADGFGVFQGAVAGAARRVAAVSPPTRVSHASLKLKKADRKQLDLLEVLVALELPFPMLLAEWLPRLRRLVGAASATIVWSESHRARGGHFNESDDCVSLQRRLDHAFANQASQAHADGPSRTFDTNEQCHTLSVPLALQAGDCGHLVLRRRGTDGPFTAVQQASVNEAAQHLHPSLDRRGTPEDRTSICTAIGWCVIQEGGAPLFVSEGLSRALALADMGTATDFLRHAPPPARVKLHRGEATRWEAATEFGRFELRTQSQRPKSPTSIPVIALSVFQHTPLDLLVFRNAERHELSAKQTMAAIAVARGDSYESMGQRLGISPHSAIDRVRDLQARFNARNRSELVARVVAAENL